MFAPRRLCGIRKSYQNLLKILMAWFNLTFLLSCSSNAKVGTLANRGVLAKMGYSSPFQITFYRLFPKIGGSRNSLKKATLMPKGRHEARYSLHTRGNGRHQKTAYVRGYASSFKCSMSTPATLTIPYLAVGLQEWCGRQNIYLKRTNDDDKYKK